MQGALEGLIGFFREMGILGVQIVAGLAVLAALEIFLLNDGQVQRIGAGQVESDERFVMRFSPINARISVIATLMLLVMATIGRDMSTGEVGNWTWFDFIWMTACCLPMLPVFGLIPGLWEIRVEGDDICIVRFWVFQRHVRFSQISYATVHSSGLECFAEGRGSKVCAIDSTMTHWRVFVRRLERAGIRFFDKETNKTMTAEEVDAMLGLRGGRQNG